MNLRLLVLLLLVALSACSSSGNNGENNPEVDPMDTNENPGLDSSEFCPAGSLYNESDDSCSVDCTGLDDEQCFAREEEVFGDFDEFVVDGYSGADGDSMNEDNAKAKYSVQEDLSLSTLAITEPNDDEKFKQIWTGVVNVLPRSKMAESVSQYHVDSDGADGTLAYVTGDDNQPGKWIIAFDDADYTSPTEREFIHTSIHEFGHIVFLGIDQLDTNGTGSCPNYGISEGCSNATSHINRFYQEFWADIFDEHSAAVQSEEGVQPFYERYEDRFVSEYAATNPVEDAAEVFTNFVLKEKPTDNSSIVNQKILMMHDIDELVGLRKEIRGKLTVTRARQRQIKN